MLELDKIYTANKNNGQWEILGKYPGHDNRFVGAKLGSSYRLMIFLETGQALHDDFQLFTLAD